MANNLLTNPVYAVGGRAQITRPDYAADDAARHHTNAVGDVLLIGDNDSHLQSVSICTHGRYILDRALTPRHMQHNAVLWITHPDPVQDSTPGRSWVSDHTYTIRFLYRSEATTALAETISVLDRLLGVGPSDYLREPAEVAHRTQLIEQHLPTFVNEINSALAALGVPA